MTISSFYNENAQAELAELRKRDTELGISSEIKAGYTAQRALYPPNKQKGAETHLLFVQFQEALLSTIEDTTDWSENLRTAPQKHFEKILGYDEYSDSKSGLEEQAIDNIIEAAENAFYLIKRVTDNFDGALQTLRSKDKSHLSRQDIITELKRMDQSDFEANRSFGRAEKYESRLTIDIIKEVHPEYFSTSLS